MIHDLDDVLRQLLINEIPIRNSEVDIVFDQPTREWAARLSRPTLNVFLHDIRENLKLRHSQQWIVEQNPDGTATQRRTPVRVDLHYIITAWANAPDDEHSLLARTLMALFRGPSLPQDLLPESLQDQPQPIPLEVAQIDELRNPPDVWNALDNEIRPSVVLTVTLALDPHLPLRSPPAARHAAGEHSGTALRAGGRSGGGNGTGRRDGGRLLERRWNHLHRPYP